MIMNRTGVPVFFSLNWFIQEARTCADAADASFEVIVEVSRQRTTTESAEPLTSSSPPSRPSLVLEEIPEGVSHASSAQTLSSC